MNGFPFGFATMWSSSTSTCTTIMMCVVAMALAFLSTTASADDVVALTEDTFEKEVGQDRGALIEFYAPW